MKIVFASDHAGYELKQHLVQYLQAQEFDILDLGVDTDHVRSDYPIVATKLATAILDGDAHRGILVCGSGVGASIAANKFPGIYAAICHDAYSAAQGVEHDNMNVLCLGGKIVGQSLAEKLVLAFLDAEFRGEGRYLERFNQVKLIEDPSENS